MLALCCIGLVNVYLVIYVMLLTADYFKHIKISYNDDCEFLTLLKELTRSSQTLRRVVWVVISPLQMGRLGEVKAGTDDQWCSQGCCKFLRTQEENCVNYSCDYELVSVGRTGTAAALLFSANSFLPAFLRASYPLARRV